MSTTKKLTVLSKRDPLKILLKAVDDNDQALAINLLKQHPNLINKEACPSKLTILQKSIYKSQDDLFSFLIEHPESRYDVETLLHAVKIGRKNMVVKIVENLRKRKINDQSACRMSSFFEPYMTPLMLACLINNFTLVRFFKSIGHTIDSPHRADCACEKCQEQRKNGEYLESSEKRLAVLQCVASYSWLLQKDFEDPLLEAMRLSREIKLCIGQEILIRDSLKNLNVQLGKFIIGLMSECSTEEQVRDILRNPVGCSNECAISLPRLRLALDLQDKEFIADRRCQKAIMTEWYGHWDDRLFTPSYVHRFRLLAHTVFYPVMSLLYIFTLGKYPKSCEIPFARFLSFAASHVYFILSLFINMQHKEARDNRGPPDSTLKQFLHLWLGLYVANRIVIMITDMWRLGFEQFFDMWWRWFDTLLNIMQLITIYAYCIAWAQVLSDGIRHAHRVHWLPSDPVLVFEILFAVSSIMSIWRTFYYLQLNKWMGPTVISVGRCIKDVSLYLIVIGLILFSFSIGLNYLYEHYKYNVVIRDGNVIEQPIYMSSIHYSFRFLYWSFYGYLPPEYLAVVVGNSGPDNTETVHDIIATVGEFLVAVYNVVIIIIMLNLMISMMTGTAAVIMANEDTEWKYICTHIRAEYFDDARSVAPPFGLIQLVINGSIYSFRKISGKSKGLILSIWDWQYTDPVFTQKDYDNYVDIMRLLTRKVLAKNDLKLRHLVSEADDKMGLKRPILTEKPVYSSKR